jgi:hypothetical protein
MFIHTFLPKIDNSNHLPEPSADAQLFASASTRILGHQPAESTTSYMKAVNKYMEQWLDGGQNAWVGASPPSNSYNDSSTKFPQDTEPWMANLPHRPPKIVDYYKGVPIYEPLPDKVLRTVLKLPSVNEISTYDLYTMHTESRADLDTATGDVACNSYYKVDEDVKLLKDLGVKTAPI